MIYYFTGTGNSHWVATQLATLRGDEVYDIAHIMHTGQYPAVAQDDSTIILVFPVHSWRAPRIVEEFISNFPRNIESTHNSALYLVCTCGDDAGKTAPMLWRRSPFATCEAWSVAMPNTYVPMFTLDDDNLCHSKIASAREQIKVIAQSIPAQGQSHKNTAPFVTHVHEGAFPWTKTHIINPLFHKFCVTHKGFHTTDACTGCGTCAAACPVHNITLNDGTPSWHSQCIHCMACYHTCPRNAIHFKTSTQHKGQYNLNKYIK